MSKIKRAFVTFEQAKLLKKKGFTKEKGCACEHGWLGRQMFFPGRKFDPDNDNCYIFDRLGNSHLIEQPEHWQVIEWLRITHSIWVEVHHIVTNGVNRFHLIIWRYEESDYRTIHCSNGVGYEVYDTPQEAYSAAIDYILKNML